MATTAFPIAMPEGSVLRIRKTVTSKKLEANRKNAKRSTGPRTQRGKRNSKFNAVTLGLFAKHVVIPTCDGYKPEKDFQMLLDELHQEYQPLGVYEEWLVVKIAESMWRLRRATRCENGSVQVASRWKYLRQQPGQAMALATEISTLTEAERQLRNSGTLSQKLYDQVLSLVEKEKNKQAQSEEANAPVGTEFNQGLFLSCIVERKYFIEAYYETLMRAEGEEYDARDDRDLLLQQEDMDRILRYEERMYRQLDWAVQRLLAQQERRKTVGGRPL